MPDNPRTNEHSLLVWQQRVAAEKLAQEEAEKNVETADKKVRKSDKEFAKGIAPGFVLGTAKGYAYLGDIFLDFARKNPKFINADPGLAPALDRYIADLQEGKSESFKSGMEMGDVASWFTGVDDVVRAGVSGVIGGSAGLIGIADDSGDLAKLLKTQVEEMKWDELHGGMKIPYNVRQYYEKLGIEWDKIAPSQNKPRQFSGFSARSPKPVTKEPAAEGAVIDRTVTAHTQGQYAPEATAGMPPPGEPQYGVLLEEHSKFAAAKNRQWEGGFDPVAFEKHKEKSFQEWLRKASKKPVGPDSVPEFWIYDKKTDKVVVVKRKKDGSLQIGGGGRQAKPIVGYEEAYVFKRDPSGNNVIDFDKNGQPKKVRIPIYNENIDIEVEDAKEWIEQVRNKVAIEEFEIEKGIAPSK